jgi:hydrogenase expression/formation protein HypE
MTDAEQNVRAKQATMTCPLPTPKDNVIVLGHGSGGRLTSSLVRDVFLARLSNPVLNRLDDSAEVSVGTGRLAFTTDSFVVQPLRFPGGDIGSLAVNGTINDLSVVGAQPIALSAAFILEEGFPIAELAPIVQSMSEAARRAGVQVVAADTKVVERGKADRIFITTSGVGVIANNIQLGPEHARAGDAILVSGPIGDHGIAVMSAREGLEFETTVVSDCAPLNGLVSAMLAAGAGIRCMRDATRGGVATVLNELGQSAGVQLLIDESAVPVRDAVRAACEILGLDPLYVACEGRLIAIVDHTRVEQTLAAMRAHPLGSQACQIGTVTSGAEPRVLLRTPLGTTRILDLLAGEQLPRIC